MNYTPNFTSYKELLKDERIKLDKEIEYEGKKYTFLKLEPKDEYSCPICGSKDTVKYGTRTKRIKLKLTNLLSDEVLLKSNRVKCKLCNRIFNDESNIVPKRNNISYITKLSILIELKKDLSFKEIASRYNISTQSVINIFDEAIDDKRLKFSEVMCFDEFKNLKSEDSKYAFLIYDPIMHKVIDILPDRTLKTLKNYFYK